MVFLTLVDGGGRHVSSEFVDDGAHVETGETLTPKRLNAKDVDKSGDHFVLSADPSVRVDARAFKMSKSRGNVINPDDVVMRYGGDLLRLFVMFMGLLEQVQPWSMGVVVVVHLFLKRVWRLLTDADCG